LDRLKIQMHISIIKRALSSLSSKKQKQTETESN